MIKRKMIEDKRGFLARDWVIALIIFSAIPALYFIVVQAMASDYGNTAIIDPSFQANYDKFNEQTETISQSFTATTGKTGFSFIGSFDAMFSAAITVINLVLGSISSFASSVYSAGNLIGIPTPISAIILTLLIVSITVILLFVFLSSVTRGRM